MGRLEGKVAVITGAASGIGAAAARRFVVEGARVVLGDIQDDAGQAFAEGLGAAATYVHCDVTREEDVANLVQTAVEKFGQLDIMYNNAGIFGAVGPIVDTPAEEWKATIDVHINGTFYGCKHAAKAMIPRKQGSIINTSSIAGLMGGFCPSAYTAAKHAIIGITRSCATELAKNGIRVNCIAPGGIATPLIADALFDDVNAMEEAKETLRQLSPLKEKYGSPEDIANSALWLASDEAANVTGHTLTVDGGLTTGTSIPPRPKFAVHQPMIREHGKRGLD